MQAILDFVNNHFYDIFLPLIILGFLRVAMCLAQLKRTATIRRKKGVYHSVRGNYTELGAWIGILLGTGQQLHKARQCAGRHLSHFQSLLYFR